MRTDAKHINVRQGHMFASVRTVVLSVREGNDQAGGGCEGFHSHLKYFSFLTSFFFSEDV